MKHFPKYAGRWWVYWPVIIVYAGLWAMPANVWFESHSLSVSDTYVMVPATVIEDRTIRKTFNGEYNAAVRDAVTGNISGGCAGSGQVRYKGRLSGVKSYSLVDFVDGRPACAALPQGRYFLEVCRTVLRPLLGILPAKTACWNSNVFNVISVEQRQQTSPQTGG